MEQEEKQLLLKDISARLPYNVVVRCTDSDTDYNCFLTTDILHEIQNGYEYYDYKPYLRSLSSMTEEEENEYRAINCYEGLFPRNEDALDYVLSHHLDFRGLIDKGLALEAPVNMYKTE